MKISVIGTGRVGSLAAFKLLEDDAGELLLANEPREWAEGLRLDLAGAFPDRAKDIRVVEFETAVKEGDVLLVCAGVARQAGQSRDDLFEANKQVLQNALQGTPKPSAFVLVVTNPVDKLADYAARLTGLSPERVIGVGGDVDTNRLRFLLAESGEHFEKCVVVGEHGEKMIPVSDADVNEETAGKLRGFSIPIISSRGATVFGVGLAAARIAESLLSVRQHLHVASIWLREQDCHIAWPCKVNENGVTPLKLELSEEQRKQLEYIVRARRLNS
ncbi:hypothetical protein HY546_00510 [archaeon]|nr:hypothetical protein [archaeon]